MTPGQNEFNRAMEKKVGIAFETHKNDEIKHQDRLSRIRNAATAHSKT
jgi:hypothetical protein